MRTLSVDELMVVGVMPLLVLVAAQKCRVLGQGRSTLSSRLLTDVFSGAGMVSLNILILVASLRP